MTTIIAAQKTDHVLFASDTQATQGYEKVDLRDGKIRRNSGYTFGVAGVYDLIPRLQDEILPEPYEEFNEAFVRQVIAPLVLSIENDCLTALKCPENIWDQYRSEILLAHSGKVFHLANGLVMPPSRSEVYAIGSGRKYALGYLSKIKNPGKRDLKNAIRTAQSHDAGTGGQIVVVQA